MKSYKEQLEALGYVVRKEIQYWSIEHAAKGVWQAKSGDLEEVCRFWWEEFEASKAKAA
jgi:hypothetical protein